MTTSNQAAARDKLPKHQTNSYMRNRHAWKDALEPKEMAKITKKIRPFLDALQNPTVQVCKDAAAVIERLVVTESNAKKTPTDDWLLFLLSLKLSVSTVRGFATLDSELIQQIETFTTSVEAYATDAHQQRPLNFLMLASPGAGKSHFIRCVATRLARRGISAITFNMSGMQSNDDLAPPLDAARNLKVEDRIPLLFLDEFDSSDSNYALLLPLLWDGGLNISQRDLRLGKAIIVMAGSNPGLPDTMEHARSMRDSATSGIGFNAKLVDLFSRINGGVLCIPPFRDISHNINRQADKVCILVHLLRQRMGPMLKVVPRALLRFVAKTDFRYDVRSIAHLVDLIPPLKNLQKMTLKHLQLPLKSPEKLKQSSLAYHLLHEDQAYGVIKAWDEACTQDAPVPIDTDAVDIFSGMPPDFFDQFIGHSLKTVEQLLK